VADEESKKPIKRGPKGGRKHTPGRGHVRKSAGAKKRRYKKRARKKRQADLEALRKAWAQWDALPADVQKMRPDLKPTEPRPTDD